MPDLVFQSTLTMDEIEENFKDVDFFEEIMKGLQEALDYENGTPVATTFVRERTLSTNCGS